MIDNDKLNLFKELFNQSQSILIICAKNAARDELFASVSLYNSIKQYTDKNIKLLCPVNLSNQETDILGLDQLKTEIGNENLCITLDYLEDSIDKVSYHTDEELKKFYLTIKPKNGAEPLSSDNVSFSYTGTRADMIVLIGVDDFKLLDQLYVGYENLFSNSYLVSINSFKTEFGTLQFSTMGFVNNDDNVEDRTQSSCFSEFVAQLLFSLELPLDFDSATNLLNGINEETEGFNSHIATADTFEVIAKLIRAGARRNGKNDKDNEVTIKVKQTS